MADKVLDAKGLNCPLPILRAKKALKDVPPGGTLEILATDPGACARKRRIAIPSSPAGQVLAGFFYVARL
jgi:TusA-related sulfurtransferase